jgi:hypothetical protein
MLSQETGDFYTTTTNHLATVTGDEIHNVFYRFDTGHIIFNRLFDYLPEALSVRGEVFDNGFRTQDSKKATALTIQYLGSQNIYNALNANNYLEDIEGFVLLIEQDIFDITSIVTMVMIHKVMHSSY